MDGFLSRDVYTTQKAGLVKQRDDTHRTKAEIQAEIIEQTRDRSVYWNQYQPYADMKPLPDDAIVDLLDHVTVWPDGRLESSLRFLDELPIPAGIDRETKTAE